MRVAVVGHTEWIWFGSVDRIPGPGEIAHATGDLRGTGGGGAVAAVQLAKLAGGGDFFTALGDDVFGDSRPANGSPALGVQVHAATARRRQPARPDARSIRQENERSPRSADDWPRHADDPLPWDRLQGADAVTSPRAMPERSRTRARHARWW